MNTRTRVTIALVLSYGAVSTASAVAQSTAFAYQGQLKNGGLPAEGLHDLRFRLFDAVSGGTQVGQPICLNDVAVSHGLFTVQLDFGQQYVAPTSRFLEIEVRADIGQPCTDAFGYVLLAPRQPITATPLASHAASAYALDAPDGSPANAVFVNSTGSVGVGTTAPLAKLQVDSGDLYLGLPTNGWFLHTRFPFGGDFLHLTDTIGGVPQFQHGLTMNKAGSVGIGTITPQAPLDVRGNIRLGTGGQLLAAGGQENLRIVRGIVDHDGSILAGSGFTVSNTSNGRYTVTFSTPFAGIPSVTATPNDFGFDNEQVVMTNGVTTNNALFVTRLHGTGLQSTAFHFIAIGPR